MLGSRAVKNTISSIPLVDAYGTSMQRDVDKGIEVCKSILSASDAEIANRVWLLDAVRRFGLSFNTWQLMEPFAHWRNSSEFGLQQFPTEFVDFLSELSRLTLVDAVEVGVFKGCSSYFAASFLQRLNSNFEYHMVDINDHIVAFDEFAAFLNLKKHVPATSNDFIGQSFDFVFIDADHSYDGSYRDFLNVGRYARKCVAFHDVRAHEYDGLNGGVVRTWREFKANHRLEMRIVEYSHCAVPWMGIGMGIK